MGAWFGGVACILALSRGLFVAPQANGQTPPGSATSIRAPERPRCAYQRAGYPEYVLWICDGEGKAITNRTSILYVRTNRSGAEVVARVWSGPLSELVRRAESIIGSHARAHARCASYFNLARAGRPAPSWNVASRSMRDWWEREGATRFSSVCYAAEPSHADFIVMWTDNDVSLPDAFSVELPAAGSQAEPDGAGAPAMNLPRDAAGCVQSALAVYQVNPGFDGAVLRLGPTVLAFDREPPQPGDDGDPLVLALEFLSTLPR
jgi:hypothetical protein